MPGNVWDRVQEIDIAGGTGYSVELGYYEAAAAMEGHGLAERAIDIGKEGLPGLRRVVIGRHRAVARL